MFWQFIDNKTYNIKFISKMAGKRVQMQSNTDLVPDFCIILSTH